MSTPFFREMLVNSLLLGGKIAVADINGNWTYAQLREMAFVAAYRMYMEGNSIGDTIMIPASGRKEFVAYYYGVHLLGAICVPYSVSSKKEVLEDIKERVNATCTVVPEEYDRLSDMKLTHEMETAIESLIVYETEEDAVVDILFTSGTTGVQKGVLLTNGGVKQAICNIAEAIAFRENDVVLLPLPLHHSNALGTMRTYISLGGMIVLLQGLKDISNMKILVDKYNCSGLSCSPVILDWIIRRYGKQCSSFLGKLRYIEIGTAPLPAGKREKIRQYFKGISLFVNYGSTETPRAVYMDINQIKKDSSIGRVVGDYESRIFDDNGMPINETTVAGRLGLKSKAMMRGYFGAQENVPTMIDGYFLTGDIAYMDGDGFIFLKGRDKDMIIVGGEKVYPDEIESIISHIPGIKECACVGIETEKAIGQQVFAYVVVEEGSNITEATVKKYLDSQMEFFKIPSRVFVVRDIPRNEMGKIDRKMLASKDFRIG